MADTPRDRVYDAVDDIGTAMLTTHGPNGLDSRPMAVHVDRDEGCLYFITRIDTGKTGEIEDDSEVNAAFAGSSRYVSVSGRATVRRDPVKAKELWSSFAEAWMPEGPEAPTTALIALKPDHATLWDTPGKAAAIIQMVKGVVTQSPPDGGKIEHVTM